MVATGETRSVRELVENSYACIGIKISWQGEGLDEMGINSETKEVLVKVDPMYFRPTVQSFSLL